MLKRYAIVLALGLGACASSNGSTKTQLYTALDVIGQTVDPASKLAKDTCSAKERAEVDEVKAGRQTAAQAQEALKPLRARCDILRKTFDRIRTTHGEAVTQVQAGAVEMAQQKLEELRMLWQSLNMLSDDEEEPKEVAK